MTRICYLGPAGTFTEAALLALIGAGRVPGCDHRTVAAETTPAALEAVRSAAADYACVPIENSIEGGVTPTLDGLAVGKPLQIFAETALDVAFSVVLAPGRTPSQVRTVAAHPVAAAQVRRWLTDHLPDAVVIPANSNAAAAQQVCDGQVDAGVSTRWAAQQRGLATLVDNVIDEPNARTRFVLVGAPALPPRRTGADRTSVVLRLNNAPGSLAVALTEFGSRGIDLTRIESRPTRTELGSYLFFLDCVGHIDDHLVSEALQALRRNSVEVRYLGSWPISTAERRGEQS